MPPAPRIIVVGARSARQGIGEFVAGWFARHGAEVNAIVGTTDASVAQARATLRDRYAIDCRGYTNLDDALAAEPGEIVAICSPYPRHAAHLAAVGRAGRHCLCEKPLCWPVPEVDPAAPFVAAGKRLAVLTQWPCTLPTFYELHPEQRGAELKSFEMRLSPITSGLDMVPDAVPHFVSMIRGLVGAQATAREQWHTEELAVEFVDGDPRRLRIDCTVVHSRGTTRATLHLATCPQRPRPAWYAINRARVERDIDLADYQQFFRAGDRRIALPDPLGLLVAQFLEALSRGEPTDRFALDHGLEQLTLFHSAVRAKGAIVDS
ncbi:MAG TPA: Gfo/Idh/MocA family oxidoreductase [Phycisphaerae bacterium]|nr:Gfo/Idh/MocA family oxidoreductase [Phycisphaerae bacterium]